MREKGIVIKNDGDSVDVQMQPSGECGSCGACFIDKTKLQVLSVNQRLKVQPGEIVEIEVNPSFAIQSAFLIFLLPLLVMIICCYIFQAYVHLPGLNNVHEGIIGALSGLTLSYIWVFLYDRHLLKLKPDRSIRIVRIVNST
jgi:sigma-E factor negative regulatory protein RseC